MAHDFNKPIEKTATEIAKVILSMLEQQKDKLVYEYDPEESKESLAKHNEEGTDFAISIFRIISATDLPADYAIQPIQKLIIFLETLKGYVEGSIRQIHDEYLSRSLEVKSPEGKYRAEFATVGALLLKLGEVQEKQGNVKEDYFNENKELSTVVAPKTKK